MNEREGSAFPGSPLAGIRVLEIANFISAPMVGLILADFGAEVIKIEAPSAGDDARRLPPEIAGEGFYFVQASRNKKSVAVDLKTDEGRRIITELVRQADVVLDNMRSGVLARLGLDYESLSRTNPKIIGCSVTGYGRGNEYSERGGYDPILQAMSGLMLATGQDGDPPLRAGAPVVDFSAAVMAALGIVLALYARQQTGVGQNVEGSLLGAACYLMASDAFYYWAAGEERSRPQRGSGGTPLIPVFETENGRMFCLSTGNYGIFTRLCHVTGLDAMAADPRFGDIGGVLRHWSDVYAAFNDCFKRKPLEEWQDRLDDARIPWGPVNTVGQFFEDPVVQANFLGTTIGADGTEIPLVRTPLQLSRSTTSPPSAPPRLGEHTDTVLTDLLGYSPREIANLRERQIVI